MLAFRTLLGLMFGVLLVYTGVVGVAHGWGLLTIFVRDIAALSWPGQFNLDFACVLLLAGLWVAWRNHFSAGGLGMGLLVAVGGTLVLAPYLLITSIQAKGDVGVLLLGKARAAA